MSYPGQDELERWLASTASPSLRQFVSNNVTNIPLWSLHASAKTGRALFRIWFDRFSRAYFKVKGDGKSLRLPKYNAFVWNSFIERMTHVDVILAETHPEEIQDSGLDKPKANQKEDTDRLIQSDNELYEHASSSGEGTSTTETAEEDEADELEGSPQTNNTHALLSLYGTKKLEGVLNKRDICTVNTLITIGYTIKDRITNYTIHLLGQPILSQTEQENLKLLLSSVVNLMDNSIRLSMQRILTRQELDLIDSHDNLKIFELDLPSLVLLDDIVDCCNNDLDNLMERIQIEKLKLLNKWKRKSNGFQMLRVLETVAQFFDKEVKNDVSESADYRKIATVLDIIFGDLDIRMVEEETCSGVPSGRKIDLILQVDDTTVELCSNEWHSTKTGNLSKKHQNKNIRVNCEIMKKAYQTHSIKMHRLMAVNFTGSYGYLYLIELKNGIYVSSLLSRFLIPTNFNQLDLFKDSIRALFMWKNFLVTATKNLKKEMMMQQLDVALDDLLSSPYSPQATLNGSLPPDVFLTPKHSIAKKRRFESLD